MSVEKVVRAEGANVKLRLKLDITQKVGEGRLKTKYEVSQYDLSAGYVLPESLKNLVPRDVPEFVDTERYVQRLMRALYHFKQCALIGPSGTGKTHVVYLVAKIAGLPLWEINCSLQTSVYDLFGRFVGLGKENWVDGLIVSWCRHGGILYLDEANMMKQDVATRLNPLLDTRGHLVLAEKDNEVIPRHKYGYVIISMNPYSVEFAGTKPLNVAFRRRLSVWINFDYLSVGSNISEREIDLVCERTKVSRELSESIVRAAAELRRRYKSGDLPYAPSVGDLINWATLIADGLPPLVAAEETIVGVASDDAEVQNSIRTTLQLIFSKKK
ncbi:MAG: AAA family ATPase [Nitrososphaerales archaeon]